MPEALAHSAVAATFWRAARAPGLDLSWVSILDPATMNAIVDVDREWRSSPICASAGLKRSISIPNWSATADKGAPKRDARSSSVEAVTFRRILPK
jgi:hypothetical protein